MTPIITFPTMPDLNCPDWCERDHDADWRLHVAAGLDAVRDPRWLQMFQPLHLRQLLRVDLGDRQSTSIDLQRGIDGKTVLYVTSDGVMSAELARTFAAELLRATDTLSEANRWAR